MFNIKNFINRVTNSNEGSNADESSPSHQHDEDQHSAEGFLCPLCMTAFSSADALKVHYETLHGDGDPAEANSDERSDNLSEIGEDIRNMQLEIESLHISLQKERDYSKEVDKQCDQSKVEFQLVNSELQSVKSAKKELQDANALLTSDVTLLRQQLGERIEQLSQMKKENEQVVVNLTSEVDKIKQENSSLKMQLAHRNSVDDAEVLKQELVAVQKMMNEVSLQKEEEIRNLKQEIVDLNKMAHEREQAFADAQLSFCEKLKEQNPTEILETQANIKIEQCMNNIQQLQKQLTEAETAKEELEVLCDNMKMQKRSDDKQISDLEKNLHNLKMELCQSTTEVARLVAESSAQAEQIAKLQLEVTEKDEVTAKTRDNLTKFEQQTSILSNSIEELKDKYGATIEEMEQKAAELVAINANLQAELEKQTDEVTNSKTAMLELQNLVELAQQEKCELRKEIEKLKEEFSANLQQLKEESEAKLLASQKDNQEKLTEIVTIKDYLKELTRRADVIEKEKAMLMTAVENVNQQILETCEQSEKAKTNYETEIGKLKADLRKIVQELEIIQKEKDEVARAHESVQSELRRQIEELRAKEASFQTEVDEKERNINHIQAELAESTSKRDQLQSQLDSILVEKLEYEKNVKQNEHKYAVLMERCLADANEKEKLHDAMSELKRKLEDSNAALQELGRENKNLVTESAKLNGRQWADDALVTICTTCEREFTLTNRKHHCRHCGQIFCKDCSSKTAKIPSSKNPVRVCDACYEELMPK